MSDDLEAIASLAEPTRAALYRYVTSTDDPVSRDDAAASCDVGRQTAAYHLDRLVDDGLLEVEFQRLTGKSGPGAGRPAKLYRRSERSFEVSVPARRYELAAAILLEAIPERDRDSLTEVARRVGSQVGERGIESALAEMGYEAEEVDGETRFKNCPFHTLVQQDREATCGLNLALVEGILERSEDDHREARLAPEEGFCCVRLTRAGTARN